MFNQFKDAYEIPVLRGLQWEILVNTCMQCLQVAQFYTYLGHVEIFNSFISFYWRSSFGFKYPPAKSAVSASQLHTVAQDKKIRLTSKKIEIN